MNRRKLEATATYLALVLLGVLLVFSIVGAADGIFAWDLLPPFLDKVAVLVMVSLFLLLAGAVLVSLMLNVSLIADRLSQIAERNREP